MHGLPASRDRGKLNFMARAIFRANLRAHVDCPETETDGSTERETLVDVLSRHGVRGMNVLDNQVALRRRLGVIVCRPSTVPTAAVNTEG